MNTPFEPTATATTVTVPTLVISPQANSNGTMFRGDLQHMGVFDAAGVQPVGEIKWKIKTEGQVWSSQVIADGVLYFGSYNTNLCHPVSILSKSIGSQEASALTKVRAD